MNQPVFLFGWFVSHNGPIRLLYLIFSQHFIHAAETFRSPGEYDSPGGGSVKPMYHTQIYGTGLVVFVFYVLLYQFTEGCVACGIALNDISRSFINNDQMVVFKENLKVLGSGNDPGAHGF